METMPNMRWRRSDSEDAESISGAACGDGYRNIKYIESESLETTGIYDGAGAIAEAPNLYPEPLAAKDIDEVASLRATWKWRIVFHPRIYPKNLDELKKYYYTIMEKRRS